MKRLIIPAIAGLTLLAGAIATSASADGVQHWPASSTTEPDTSSTELPDTTLPPTTTGPTTAPPSSTTLPPTTTGPTTAPPTSTTYPPPPTPSPTPPSTTLPPFSLITYDERCGGAITVKANYPTEVVLEPLGYHFIASQTPATLLLGPRKYSIVLDGKTLASFAIESCPLPTFPPPSTAPATTAPPSAATVVVDIGTPPVPAVVPAELPETR